MLETTSIAPVGATAPTASTTERSASTARRSSTRNKRPAAAPVTEPPPQYRSDELLRNGEEALILHGDDVYRLRRTWTGKLILTK